MEPYQGPLRTHLGPHLRQRVFHIKPLGPHPGPLIPNLATLRPYLEPQRAAYGIPPPYATRNFP